MTNSKPHRTYGTRRYKRRNRIEIKTGRLQEWRGAATRHERWPDLPFGVGFRGHSVDLDRDRKTQSLIRFRRAFIYCQKSADKESRSSDECEECREIDDFDDQTSCGHKGKYG